MADAAISKLFPITTNQFLVGLNGAGVLYYFFCSKYDIVCGGPKYFTQWHLVSLNCMRDNS